MMKFLIIFIFIILINSKNYLKEGDEVIIISPSGSLSKLAQETVINNTKTILIEKWKLKPTYGRFVFSNSSNLGGFAGTDSQRLQDLEFALYSKTFKAIFCTRGGYGLNRILSKIDFKKVVPKLFIGYSDITAILIAFDKLKLKGAIHSSMLGSNSFQYNLNSLETLLFRNNYFITSPNTRYNRIGNSNSTLVGGNLSLLIDSLSTEHEIDTNGKILFIEEIEENLYKIDRMIQSLKRAKKFDNLKGLIIGQCNFYILNV
jgi:muramoyltetrapeptide carboxypeptidase